jgi:hypothetical protein
VSEGIVFILVDDSIDHSKQNLCVRCPIPNCFKGRVILLSSTRLHTVFTFWGRLNLVHYYWFHPKAFIVPPKGTDEWGRVWNNRWDTWQEKANYSEITCPSAAFFDTNPTWPDPVSNQYGRDRKPVTNSLSYGTEFAHWLLYRRATGHALTRVASALWFSYNSLEDVILGTQYQLWNLNNNDQEWRLLGCHAVWLV